MGIVGYTCKPGFGTLRQEEHKFKNSLVYRVRTCLKSKTIQHRTKLTPVSPDLTISPGKVCL